MRKKFQKVIYHSSLFKVPSFQNGILSVWSRNFYYFRKTWKTAIFWMILEPLFYLIALGYGLGAFVHGIGDLPYLEFFYSGLIMVTAMIVSFFESSYGGYSKLNHQKLYASILLSPLTPEEIALGEILWGATKGFLSALGVIFISSFWGITHSWMLFAVLPLLFIMSWIFSCLGLIATSYAKNTDMFIYTSSGLIIPLSLFSGTYFPIENYSVVIKGFIYLFPLTHGVAAARELLYYGVDNWIFAHIAVLLFFAFFLMNIAVEKFSKKIIN